MKFGGEDFSTCQERALEISGRISGDTWERISEISLQILHLFSRNFVQQRGLLRLVRHQEVGENTILKRHLEASKTVSPKAHLLKRDFHVHGISSGQNLNTSLFVSNFSGTAGISQPNSQKIPPTKVYCPRVSRVCFPWASRDIVSDIPNFLAPTPFTQNSEFVPEILRFVSSEIMHVIDNVSLTMCHC